MSRNWLLDDKNKLGQWAKLPLANDRQQRLYLVSGSDMKDIVRNSAFWSLYYEIVSACECISFDGQPNNPYLIYLVVLKSLKLPVGLDKLCINSLSCTKYNSSQEIKMSRLALIKNWQSYQYHMNCDISGSWTDGCRSSSMTWRAHYLLDIFFFQERKLNCIVCSWALGHKMCSTAKFVSVAKPP